MSPFLLNQRFVFLLQQIERMDYSLYEPQEEQSLVYTVNLDYENKFLNSNKWTAFERRMIDVDVNYDDYDYDEDDYVQYRDQFWVENIVERFHSVLNDDDDDDDGGHDDDL